MHVGTNLCVFDGREPSFCLRNAFSTEMVCSREREREGGGGEGRKRGRKRGGSELEKCLHSLPIRQYYVEATVIIGQARGLQFNDLPQIDCLPFFLSL